MSNISFDNAWLLLLAIPLLAAVIVPFVITVRRDNANFHNVAAVCLESLICICITLAVAGMTFESVITRTDVYVLADVSYSADHNLDEVQERVEQISGKLPKNSRMGVICFGRDFKLISDLGSGVPDVVAAAESIDRSGTDIATAMRYAGNLFDDDVIKRIIVITDGVETVTSNNIIKVVGILQDSDVNVDAVYLDDNPDPAVKELQIEGVDAVSSTYLNKREEIKVMVRANCGEDRDARTGGYVNVYRNGERIERKTAVFYTGLNVFGINVPTDEAGQFEYTVSVEPERAADDYSPYNNSYIFTQKISDQRKVLFIGGTSADVAAGKRIYGETDVTYISEVSEIPLSVEEMCAYDEIVLSNFDVRTIRAGTMFMSSLSTLVDEFGKTLTTFGNTYIQDDKDNDAALKMLADLLPVNIGNSDTETRLFTLVLDISTSMNFSGKFVIAKRAAIELLNSLNSKDYVMVIGFSGGVTELLPPTRFTNTSVIIDAIENAETENETNLSAALTHAANLMPARFRDRQLFVISDGMNPASDNDAALEKAEELSKAGVAVSALGVFAEGTGDALLNGIVNNAYANKNVQYVNITDEQDVTGILDSITEEKEQVKIEGDLYEISVRGNESVLEGVGKIEAIKGFWYNSAKSTATVPVTAKYYRDKITSFDVPVYAYWNGGGKGKVVSFTSDPTSDWTGLWGEGSAGSVFLFNIPEAALPDEKNDAPFIVSSETGEGKTRVTVTASPTLVYSSDFKVSVTDPDGQTITKNLVFGSGTYTAEFDTDGTGVYKVYVQYNSADAKFEASSEFTVSYYAEYDAFGAYSKSYLYRLLTENGAILELDRIGTIENGNASYVTYVFSFTMPLMIICAVLFMACIIIRQLKWKDVTSFFKGLKRTKRS